MSAAARRWRLHAGPLLLGVIPLIFVFSFFLYPLIRLFLTSFQGGDIAGYSRALTDSLYAGVLIDTLRLALVVTAICFVLAYPVAYLLANVSRVWAAVGFGCLLLPFWTSVLVRTYAWMILLGRNGIVNRALLDLEIVTEPLPLLYNETGVVIGMVHVLLPYMVFPIYAVMRRIDRDLPAAAAGLGASPWRVFTRIYFPMTLPGAYAGAVLVFVVALGFFITPALLGGGRVPMIANMTDILINRMPRWELAAALSTLLLLVTFACYAVYLKVSKRGAA